MTIQFITLAFFFQLLNLILMFTVTISKNSASNLVPFSHKPSPELAKYSPQFHIPFQFDAYTFRCVISVKANH
jgi:hypothetical protein